MSYPLQEELYALLTVINRDLLINRSVQRIVIRTFSVMHTKQEEIQDTAEHFVVVELMNALSDLRWHTGGVRCASLLLFLHVNMKESHMLKVPAFRQQCI